MVRVRDIIGGRSFSHFVALYCTKMLDADGNTIPGKYKINPDTRPSNRMKYGTRDGSILQNTFADDVFSLDLLTNNS